LMTPKWAAELLENRYHLQRPIRQSHIDKIASDIKSGNWIMNNDSVVLIKGKLANGQHRLSAIIKTGIPVSVIFYRTDNEAVWDIIDGQMLPRSIADVMRNVEYAGDMGAVAKVVLRYDDHKLYLSGGGKAVGTRHEILNLMKQNTEKLTDAVKVAKYGYSKGQPCIPVSTAASFLFLAGRNEGDEESAIEFIKYLYNGECDITLPVYVNELREKLIKYKNHPSQSLGKGYVFALIIRCYNAFKNGQSVFRSTAIPKTAKFPRFYFEKEEEIEEVEVFETVEPATAKKKG